MNKGNMIGLGVMAAASVFVVAATGPVYEAVKQQQLNAAAGGMETTVVTGEGSGYGETPIQAEVTLAGDKIIALELVGEGETPDIGGTAMETLKDAILAAGSIDGVDGVTGATWTSNGVFEAIRSAMGVEPEQEEVAETEGVSMEASGLSHGLGFYTTGRVGPGADDQEQKVYSFNEVVAYALFDNDGRIMDLEIDQLEVATPNYDGASMPDFTGFPGQSYNKDEDHDGVVDRVAEQTDETYLAEVDGWKTKRERGSGYKMGTGTWSDQMDIFESLFQGMTVEEVKAWYEANCSDVNGRPLHGTSDKEEDIAKYEALSDEAKAELDGISGATMSLNDSHGNIIGAIERAYENRVAVNAETISKIGLGFTNTGRVGPGKDDQGVGVYSFNTQAAGAAYDEEGRILALYTDVMEVATPNYDGAGMPDFTGFPNQNYNADEDHDGVVDTLLGQTEESFLEQVKAWKTKRERGSGYKLNSGTWSGEMDLFQNYFTGMTADEVNSWFDKYCSDVNGRPLFGTSDKEEDVAKYDALTEEEKAGLDGISGATMSLKDPHGDILGAIINSWENAKETDIVVK